MQVMLVSWLIRFEDLKKYNKSTFLQDENSFISPSKKKIHLSKKLQLTVNEIIETDEFANPIYRHGYSIEKFRELLTENNIARHNIESRDINESYNKNLSFKCPECGKYYEATAENWIIKQYHQDGNMWIVCKEVCGKNDI